MKIERINLYHIRMPLLTPFETSFGRSVFRECLLIEVFADGLVGLELGGGDYTKDGEWERVDEDGGARGPVEGEASARVSDHVAGAKPGGAADRGAGDREGLVVDLAVSWVDCSLDVGEDVVEGWRGCVEG